MSQFLAPVRALAPATALIAAMAFSAGASAATLNEGFDTTTSLVPLPAGWTAVNNSSTVGTISWFKANTEVMTAQAGAADSYISANFNSGAGTADISNWLILPTLSFNNGDVLSFYTRTVDLPANPDRLEVRFSSVGGINVGASSTSVGDFSTLLLTVNPGLTTTGYPNSWTQYTATISGLSGPTSGAIAFRYFVTNGGPDGLNSDYIGIDSVSIAAVPEPAAWLMLALGLGMLGLRRARAAVA